MSIYQIAIDGPAGSGKSTVAKEVANMLDFLYVDTGAMYRAITLKILRDNIDLNDQNKLINEARKCKITFKKKDNNSQIVMLNDENVSNDIRNPYVTATVSHISKIQGIRKSLVKLQQELGAENSVVMEGRDIGSVVFPKAFLKIYLTASIAERAKRRFEEYEASGVECDLDKLKTEIAERDLIDSTRKNSPLTKVHDAIEIETDNLNASQVAEKIINLFREKLENENSI